MQCQAPDINRGASPLLCLKEIVSYGLRLQMTRYGQEPLRVRGCPGAPLRGSWWGPLPAAGRWDARRELASFLGQRLAFSREATVRKAVENSLPASPSCRGAPCPLPGAAARQPPRAPRISREPSSAQPGPAGAASPQTAPRWGTSNGRSTSTPTMRVGNLPGGL